jgi:hypothetical protein
VLHRTLEYLGVPYDAPPPSKGDETMRPVAATP